MKKLLGIGAVVLSLGMATPAYAVNFTVDDYTVTLRDLDPGLVVTATDVMADNYGFALNVVGQTHQTNLFTIATTEDSIQGDDTVAYPISVSFLFSAPPPAFGGSAGGTTDGSLSLVNPLVCGAFACGHLDWNNTSQATALNINFGSTGQLQVWLTSEDFPLPGSDTVQVTFRLAALDVVINPTIPEPTSLALFGSGLLACVAGLRRRKKA